MIKLTYEFENVDQLWEHVQTVKGITVTAGEVEITALNSSVFDLSQKQNLVDNTVKCAICGTPFIPKTKRSRLCSKKCTNIEQIGKKDPSKVDELLAKIKKECPVKELQRPTSYREFL